MKKYYCNGKNDWCDNGGNCIDHETVPLPAVSIVVTDVVRDIFNELRCEMVRSYDTEGEPTLVIHKDRFEAIRDKYIPKEEA